MWTSGVLQPDAKALVASPCGGTEWMEQAMRAGTMDRHSECAGFASSIGAYAAPTRLMQGYQELTLTRAAQKHESVTVMYSAEATSISQSGDGGNGSFDAMLEAVDGALRVEATVVQQPAADAAPSEARRTITVRSKFAVGCDGPRSLVGKTMGAKFDGCVAPCANLTARPSARLTSPAGQPVRNGASRPHSRASGTSTSSRRARTSSALLGCSTACASTSAARTSTTSTASASAWATSCASLPRFAFGLVGRLIG